MGSAAGPSVLTPAAPVAGTPPTPLAIPTLRRQPQSPLHTPQAAYKGEADCVRLLLALGCDALALDAEVATPLHWAALRGQGEAATLLVHGGGAGALCAADGTGGTPEALARGKGHALLAERLARQRVETERRRTRARWAGGASPGGVNGGLAGLTLVVGDGVVVRPVAALAAATAAIARLHLLPISFIIILGLLVTFLTRVIAASGAPPPSAGSVTAAVATTALAALSLALALATATADPGVLPRAGDGGDGGKRAADEGDGRVAGWAGGRAGVGTTPGGGACPPPPHPLDTPALSSHADWGRLCVACRTVRPLRAKHCPVTGRCVARFDHYCPWMGCTVGAGNHATFLAFLASTLAAIVLAETTAVLRLAATVTAGSAAAPTDPAASDAAVWAALWMAVFVVVDAFALLALGTLAVVQARQVSTNLTTNVSGETSQGGGERGWCIWERMACGSASAVRPRPLPPPTPVPRRRRPSTGTATPTSALRAVASTTPTTRGATPTGVRCCGAGGAAAGAGAGGHCWAAAEAGAVFRQWPGGAPQQGATPGSTGGRSGCGGGAGATAVQKKGKLGAGRRQGPPSAPAPAPQGAPAKGQNINFSKFAALGPRSETQGFGQNLEARLLLSKAAAKAWRTQSRVQSLENPKTGPKALGTQSRAQTLSRPPSLQKAGQSFDTPKSGPKP